MSKVEDWPVGTRVRVIANTNGHHYWDLPVEGVVVRNIYSEENYVRVQSLPVGPIPEQWIYPQDLVRSEPDTETEGWD